jgi:PAB1-binding protein PBP1
MSHNNRARARAGAFRTDTDISRQKPAPGERELQPWQPDPSGDALEGGLGDDVTFGGAVGKTGGGKGWDQFATNAALFGATTTYSEDLYTTRLDRSKQGFKQREREAERLAREIEGQVTTNVHVAEERGQQVQGGEGWDEEDRYSGVQRRAGAYVPPGARSGKVVGKESSKETGKDVKEDKETPAQPTTELATHDSGNAKAPPQEPIKPSPAKDALKVSPAKPNPSPASAAPADITSTMREFAQTERSKIAQAKADMHKTERDRRLAELVNFGKTFKVPGAKPRDLQGVLAGSAGQEKREEKNVTKAVPAPAPAVASSKPQLANGHRPPIASGTHAAKPRISMHIPEIPPFKGAARPLGPSQQQPPPPKLVVPATADVPVPGIAGPSQTTKDAKRPDAPPVAGGLNPAAAAFAFKPNPAASTFKPVSLGSFPFCAVLD